jgi:N-methylhydantoinase B
MNTIELSLFSSRLTAVCDEMGAVLQRAAFSTNIKDRLDFSCAVFGPEGELCAQAAHIPVHLGSMAFAMQDLVAGTDWAPGDVLIVNDPFLGGTHLPDVTLIAPVYVADAAIGFVANRAHHADIGADTPGSMPISRSLEEEGIVIPPTHLVRAGQPVAAVMRRIVNAITNPVQMEGDLAAQLSANRAGEQRLVELGQAMGLKGFKAGLVAVNNYGARLAEKALSALPNGCYHFRDVMDDDGMGQQDIPIVVTLQVSDGNVDVDFDGTALQVEGNINCPLSVTAAGVFYVFRCLMPAHTPACAGSFRNIRLSAPEGCLVNAGRPAAVAAGNVETSTFSWDYYETIGGGMGGGSRQAGLSATQSHMTNTLNTPVEVLEMEFPLRVNRYQIRLGSGGAGIHRGGDGLVREFEFLAPTAVTLLTERRRRQPWGLHAGAPGAAGENRYNGKLLPGKVTLDARAGERLSVYTPGGGGWGKGRA